MNDKGFSLLEMIMVMSIISVVAVLATGQFRNFIKNIELKTAASGIISELKSARAKAMAGEDSLRWGIHFVNDADDYYELFSTPSDYVSASTTVKTTTFLPGLVIFTDPAESGTKDMIFSQVTGTSTTASVTVFFENNTRTVTTTAIGNIYY